MTRVALVTGSDSGIGKATAVALANSGCDVGITWHADRDGAEHTAAQVRASGRRAELRQLDVTSVHEHFPLVGSSADGGLTRMGPMINRARDPHWRE